MTSRSLFLLPLAFTVSTLAAQPQRELTLAEALARTLQGSPELAAQSWEVRAAEARILQARQKPNPTLDLTVENATGSGRYKNGDEMETTLQLSQLIELGGKLPARVGYARADRAVADWEYQVKRNEVLKTTAIAFIEVLAAQRRVTLVEEVLKVSEEAAAQTSQRVSVGKASTVEGTRATVAIGSGRIEVEQARRELQVARARLALQWGDRRADFGMVRGDLDRRKEAPPVEALRARLAGNPQLARWQAEKEKRRAALVRQQAEARPDLTVLAGPRMEGKAEDATFIAGFSLPLPIRHRNQGNIAEAQANLAKIEHEQRAAEARAFAELTEAYERLMAAGEQALILESSVLPGARDAEKLLTEGYGAGRFTQLEVLEARRSLNEARAQHLKALTEYHKALAEIDALTAAPMTAAVDNKLTLPVSR